MSSTLDVDSPGVQPHGLGDGLDEVVPLHVEEVPRGDLWQRVPAGEGHPGELDAPRVEEHPGHAGEGEPLQVHVGDALQAKNEKKNVLFFIATTSRYNDRLTFF